MMFDVSHRTTYRYGTPVAESHHLVHLKPRSSPFQTVGRHTLLIEPAPVSQSEIIDYFGNEAAILVIEEEHSDVVFHARSTVEVKAKPRPNLAVSSTWEEVGTAAAREAGGSGSGVLQYTCESRHTPLGPEVLDFARASFPPGRPVLEGAWDLAQRIYSEFVFDSTATDISTPITEVLRVRAGVCQDFSHLALGCLRSLGVPGRYVSGYLLTHPPPGREKLQGADSSHGWFSVWAPETGWVDFDPTNGLIPDDQHITIGYGRDYEDVSPISGVLLGGGDQSMSVAVDVTVIR